jgi:hypothetical protein
MFEKIFLFIIFIKIDILWKNIQNKMIIFIFHNIKVKIFILLCFLSHFFMERILKRKKKIKKTKLKI